MIIYFFPKVSTTHSKAELENYCTQAISVCQLSHYLSKHSTALPSSQCILIFTCLFLSAEYFKSSLTTRIMKKLLSQGNNTICS